MSPEIFSNWRYSNRVVRDWGQNLGLMFVSVPSTMPQMARDTYWLLINSHWITKWKFTGALCAARLHTQIDLSRGILSKRWYFIRAVTRSWLDEQSETKGMCFKAKYIYPTTTGMFYFGWEVEQNDPYLEVFRLRKIQRVCFVLFLFCLFFKDTAMNSAGKLAGSQTAVLAWKDDTGQRRKKKAAKASKAFCKVLQSFPGFSG